MEVQSEEKWDRCLGQRMEDKKAKELMKEASMVLHLALTMGNLRA